MVGKISPLSLEKTHPAAGEKHGENTFAGEELVKSAGPGIFHAQWATYCCGALIGNAVGLPSEAGWIRPWNMAPDGQKLEGTQMMNRRYNHQLMVR